MENNIFKHWVISKRIIYSFDTTKQVIATGWIEHIKPEPYIMVNKDYIVPEQNNLIAKSNLLFDKYVQLRDEHKKDIADIFYQKYLELRGRVWVNPSLS